MTDPFDASKRDLEERDRTRILVADARTILDQIDDDWGQWPRETLIRRLMSRGPFSWSDARNVLEIIDFEDGNATMTTPEFLRDLAKRLMAVPVAYGVDQGDVDLLNRAAAKWERLIEAEGIEEIES